MKKWTALMLTLLLLLSCLPRMGVKAAAADAPLQTDTVEAEESPAPGEGDVQTPAEDAGVGAPDAEASPELPTQEEVLPGEPESEAPSADPGAPAAPAEGEDPQEPSEPVEPAEPTEPEQPQPEFVDVDGHWAEKNIRRAVELGLMNGESKTKFGPDHPMTRAMFVTVLYRLEKRLSGAAPKTGSEPLPFVDVPVRSYYTTPVRWAVGAGVVNGVSADCFAPNDNCIREQAVTLLYRYARYRELPGEESAYLGVYRDIIRLSRYARRSMVWAVGAGLINGTGGGKLSPRSNMTRAQFATVLVRFCDYLDGTLPTPTTAALPGPVVPGGTEICVLSDGTVAGDTAGGIRYVRLQALSDCLGGTLKGGSSSGISTVTLTAREQKAVFYQNFPLMDHGGRTKQLPGPALVQDGEWYIPSDAIAEIFSTGVCESPGGERIYYWRVEPCQQGFFVGDAQLTGCGTAFGTWYLSGEEFARHSGGSFFVTTDPGSLTATLTAWGATVTLPLGGQEVTVNGAGLSLAAPVLGDGEAWWIPVELITEGLRLPEAVESDTGNRYFGRISPTTTVIWVQAVKAPKSWLLGDARYLPLSDLAELLGGSLTQEEQTAELTALGHTLTLRPGRILTLDGKSRSIAQPVFRQEGVWLVPAGAVTALFGYAELWDREWNQIFYTKIVRSAQVPQGYSVPVLMYHGVTDNTWGATELFVSPAEMEKQLQRLLARGCTPITFEDLDRINQIKKPVMLTFDDGYRDNYTELFPLLKKYNVKVTIFMVSGAIGNSRSLTKAQIQEMTDSGLVSIQSHTVSHEELDTLSGNQLEYETSASMLALARITHQQPFVLCYPSGKINGTALQYVKKYYEFGLCMGGPRYTTGRDPYHIYRYYVSRTTTINQFTAFIW